MSFQVPRNSLRTGGVGDYEGSEHGRNIQQSSKVAVIKEIDLEKVRARVTFGDPEDANNSFASGWLPIVQPASSVGRSGVSAWQPPQVGDPVQVSCPGGELAQGQIFPLNHMRPADMPFGDRASGYEFGDLGDARTSVYRKLFSDGTLIEYDIEQKLVRVETSGSVKAHACGQIILKSPFIQLDADQVHVTGKLMLSDQVVGMKKDLTGTRKLDFLGDTIQLNDNGGMFGIAAGLISTFGLTTMTGAIGGFGNFGSMFSGLTSQFGPMGGLSSVLGASGLSSILPSGVLGGLTSAVGVSNLIDPLSTAMGFALEVTTGGLPQFPQDPWQMAGLALDIAQATGAPLPPGASLVTDALGGLTGGNFDGQATIAGWLGSNTITSEDLTAVAGAAGVMPTDTAGLSGFVTGLSDTLQQPVDQGGAGLSYSSADVVNGMQTGFTSVTDGDMTEAIYSESLAADWEMLYHGGVSPGDMMSSFVDSGQIDLESLLGFATSLQRDGNGPQAGDDCDIEVKSNA